jgi:hypothetical protein
MMLEKNIAEKLKNLDVVDFPLQNGQDESKTNE